MPVCCHDPHHNGHGLSPSGTVCPKSNASFYKVAFYGVVSQQWETKKVHFWGPGLQVLKACRASILTASTPSFYFVTLNLALYTQVCTHRHLELCTRLAHLPQLLASCPVRLVSSLCILHSIAQGLFPPNRQPGSFLTQTLKTPYT